MQLVATAAAQVPTWLAHQGGWDEILMFAVPVAVFAALLRAANRRASRIGGADGTGEGGAAVDGTEGPVETGPPRNPRAGPT